MGKKITSKAEIDKYYELIKDFPIIHNTLKADFVLLMETMVTYEDDVRVSSFYRSLLSSFYSMVEADLYYYNQFDPYPKYNDHDKFKSKFKKTFSQICETWGRQDLLDDYYLNEGEVIFELKDVRNGLIHPKSLQSITLSSDDDIEKVLACYNRYTIFISLLMKDFFFDIQGRSPYETFELVNYVSEKMKS